MKLNNKLVYWSVGLLLILALALLSLIPKNDQASANLTIISKGQQIKTFTMEEIKKLPVVEQKVTIRSSSEGTKTYVFTGTPVRKILTDIDTLKDIKQITAKGLDSYTVAFNSEEIMTDDNVLLVYAQDDKPLGSKTSGGTGPFRIIVSDDQFGLRAVKYVNVLEVN